MAFDINAVALVIGYVVIGFGAAVALMLITYLAADYILRRGRYIMEFCRFLKERRRQR